MSHWTSNEVHEAEHESIEKFNIFLYRRKHGTFQLHRLASTVDEFKIVLDLEQNQTLLNKIPMKTNHNQVDQIRPYWTKLDHDEPN